MRKYMWIVGLSGILLSAAVLAQDKQGPGQPGKPPDPLQQIELETRHLNVQAHQDEVNFQRQMKELQVEKQRAELEKIRQPARPPMSQCPMRCHRGMGAFLMGCFLIHILLAVWVYQDIRRRNAGSGIWIVVTLLIGFFGALLYAIVRLGDRQS